MLMGQSCTAVVDISDGCVRDVYYENGNVLPTVVNTYMPMLAYKACCCMQLYTPRERVCELLYLRVPQCVCLCWTYACDGM